LASDAVSSVFSHCGVIARRALIRVIGAHLETVATSTIGATAACRRSMFHGLPRTQQRL
jgi:hypothetical protein